MANLRDDQMSKRHCAIHIDHHKPPLTEVKQGRHQIWSQARCDTVLLGRPVGVQELGSGESKTFRNSDQIHPKLIKPLQ